MLDVPVGIAGIVAGIVLIVWGVRRDLRDFRAGR